MKFKNGFSLIEILAVIAALAIILVIIVPKIMSIYTSSKTDAFDNEVKSIIKTINIKRGIDDAYDINAITASNMANEIKMGNDNIETLAVSLTNDDDVYIDLVGKNKWSGFQYHGTLKSKSSCVVVPEYCFTFDTGTISSYIWNDSNCSKCLIIPKTISGTTVTTIGNNAFQNKGLVEVVIPSNVTTIGDFAFASNSLTNLQILPGVNSIGASTFYHNNLTSISIPATITTIGSGAFEANALTNITMYKTGITVGAWLLNSSNNYFRTAYNAGGAGTYTGTQFGAWAKS